MPRKKNVKQKKNSSKKSKRQEAPEKVDKKVQVEGTVVEYLQDTNYLVEIELEGYKLKLTAYPSGRMRTHYRGRINVGDKVTVEVDPEYNIELGRIVRKHPPKRYFNNANSVQKKS